METNQPYSQGPYPPVQPYVPVPRKPPLPDSIVTLVMGVAGLAHMAFFGWILSIIAISKGNKALEAAEREPGRYNETTISMARSGRKMGTIGLILGLLGILVWVLYFGIIFWAVGMAGSHTY